MKARSRQMMGFLLLGAAVLALSGCDAWPLNGQPMPLL